VNWLFVLALKNLRRNLRRTLISSVAVVAGVTLMIIGNGLIGGLNEGIIRAQIDSQSGHVSLLPPSIEPDAVTHPVSDLEAVPDEIQQAVGAYTSTTRVLFDLRIIFGRDAARGTGVGYEPASDAAVFLRGSQDLEGVWPEERGGQGLVLGKSLAGLLGVSVGDVVSVQTRTADGAQNALDLTIVGVVHAHNPAVDNQSVFMVMDEAIRLVDARGPSQIALRLSRRGDSDAVADKLKAVATQSGWSVESYSVAADDLLQINRVREKALRLMIFVILAIAATGIANTIIMSVYERIREVGTMAAMGMQPRRIRLLFLVEGAIMGLLASIVGALLGAGINHHFSVHGFDVGNLPDATSRVPFSTTIYTSYSLSMVFLAVAFGVTVAVLASVWPARFASRLDPATAVRED